MNARENSPPWWTWRGAVERRYANVRRLYRPWWTWNGGTRGLVWYALASAERARGMQ